MSEDILPDGYEEAQTMYFPGPGASLAVAFSLQDEIRQLKENIGIVQREVDRREEMISAIIQEHRNAGIMNEGPLSILEKPGRRSLNLKAFEETYPDKFTRVAKVKYSATIADAERVLSGEEVEAICTRSESTWIIDYNLRKWSE